MIFLSFELTMPNRGSWNGKWTGEDRKYFVIKKFKDKSPEAKKAKELLHDAVSNSFISRGFYYRWEDGWGANVQMEITNSKSASDRRKKSAGFCGYEWMIDSILKHGKIYASHEEIPV